MLISRGSQSSMKVLGIELWPTFLIWKKEGQASSDFWAFGFLPGYLGNISTIGRTRERGKSEL